ncbi:MAG: hypothetical protein HYY09_06395 [Firmicutes bacterium]|nr:hypothetical protein [Bacillota bacterium]
MSLNSPVLWLFGLLGLILFSLVLTWAKTPRSAGPINIDSNISKKDKNAAVKGNTVLAVISTIVLMPVIWLATGVILRFIALKFSNDWEFIGKYLKQDTTYDIALGLACLGGLIIYYNLCKRTKAARRIGAVFGIVFIIVNFIIFVSSFSTVGMIFFSVIMGYFSSKHKFYFCGNPDNVSKGESN